MINSTKIQREYNKVYKEIRNYIWDFQAVEALADFEISVYKLCPDLSDIQTKFDRLRYYTRDIELEDKDLAKAMDNFEELLQSDDTPYAKLWSVKEVIQQ